MQKSIIVLASCACLLAGCSSVTVTRVPDDDTSEGIHFYEPRPYLLVTKAEAKDASSTVTTTFVNQILWLPDHSRRCKVVIKSRWGSANGSVKLLNGWMLDTLGAQTDSKIPETITAVGGLIAAIPRLRSAKPPVPELTEGLYLIQIDGSGEVSFKRTGQVTQ